MIEIVENRLDDTRKKSSLSVAAERVVEFLKAERLCTQLLSIAVLLAFWQIIGAQVNPILLSTPSRVVGELWRMIASGELEMATLQTLEVYSIALVLTMVVGIPLGLLTGYFKIAQNFLDIWVRILYVLPSIALMPVMVGWMGIGLGLKIAVAFWSALFVVWINTDAGVRSINPLFVDVARSFSASQRQMATRVILPACVPFIVAGLRIAVARALLGTVVAEMFASASGLGYLLLRYGNSFFTARVFSVLIILAVISLATTALLERVEARFAIWRRG